MQSVLRRYLFYVLKENRDIWFLFDFVSKWWVITGHHYNTGAALPWPTAFRLCAWAHKGGRWIAAISHLHASLY